MRLAAWIAGDNADALSWRHRKAWIHRSQGARFLVSLSRDLNGAIAGAEHLFRAVLKYEPLGVEQLGILGSV